MPDDFTIPPNPDPEVLAWPYFVFADHVGLPMERLDEWDGRSEGRRRTMTLTDTAGGTWVAEGYIDTEPPVFSPPSDADIRAWARSRGLDVTDRGRVGSAVRSAYLRWTVDYLGPWPSSFTVVVRPDGPAAGSDWYFIDSFARWEHHRDRGANATPPVVAEVYIGHGTEGEGACKVEWVDLTSADGGVGMRLTFFSEEWPWLAGSPVVDVLTAIAGSDPTPEAFMAQLLAGGFVDRTEEGG